MNYQCQNPDCRKEFTGKPASKRKYCSKRCASAVRESCPLICANPNCKKEFKSRKERKYCSNKCANCMKRTPSVWTEDKKVFILANPLMTFQQLAGAFGISIGAVKKQLCVWKIKLRRPGPKVGDRKVMGGHWYVFEGRNEMRNPIWRKGEMVEPKPKKQPKTASPKKPQLPKKAAQNNRKQQKPYTIANPVGNPDSGIKVTGKILDPETQHAVRINSKTFVIKKKTRF